LLRKLDRLDPGYKALGTQHEMKFGTGPIVRRRRSSAHYRSRSVYGRCPLPEGRRASHSCEPYGHGAHPLHRHGDGERKERTRRVAVADLTQAESRSRGREAAVTDESARSGKGQLGADKKSTKKKKKINEKAVQGISRQGQVTFRGQAVADGESPKRLRRHATRGACPRRMKIHRLAKGKERKPATC